MNKWQKLAMRNGSQYVWQGHPTMRAMHISRRKMSFYATRATTEIRRDGLDPFQHVRTIRIRDQKRGPNQKDWQLSAYGCFVIAQLRGDLEAELFFGDLTTELRRSILRCQFKDCPNAGTRDVWGATFCTLHMPKYQDLMAGRLSVEDDKEVHRACA